MFEINNYTLQVSFDKLQKNGNIEKLLYLFPLSIRISDFETQFLDDNDKLLFIRDCLLSYNLHNEINNSKINNDFVYLSKDFTSNKYQNLDSLIKNMDKYLISEFNSCKTINLLNYLVGHFIHVIEHYIPLEIIEDKELFLDKSKLLKGINNNIDIECDKIIDFR